MSEKGNKLPVAELFHSLQGEGRWIGCPMLFVRLAGCTVGFPEKDAPEIRLPPDVPPLEPEAKPPTAWKCYTFDNRPFWCDTNFRTYNHLSVEEIFDECWEDHICLTGGEPLVHAVRLSRHHFFSKAYDLKKRVHIETSGTIQYTRWNKSEWLTVAPKRGYLTSMINAADELKLLVDERFDYKSLPPEFKSHPRVYIQPINDEFTVNDENITRCLDILELRPDWMFSPQLHKLLGMR